MIRSELIGCWEVDPSDAGAFREFGRTTMEFREDGSLTYKIITDEGKHQVMFLTFIVEGDMIVTNQPSHPREDRTRFAFAGDDELRLTQGSTTVVYRRVSGGEQRRQKKRWWQRGR